MSITQETHDLVLSRNPVCIWCGERKSAHCHHGIKRGTKSKHHPHPEYDHIENLAALCERCNLTKGVVETFEFAEWFGWHQLSQGIDVVSWYNKLDMRIKDNYSWLKKDLVDYWVGRIKNTLTPGIKYRYVAREMVRVYKRISNDKEIQVPMV
jgi:hypothetical protein